MTDFQRDLLRTMRDAVHGVPGGLSELAFQMGETFEWRGSQRTNEANVSKMLWGAKHFPVIALPELFKVVGADVITTPLQLEYLRIQSTRKLEQARRR